MPKDTLVAARVEERKVGDVKYKSAVADVKAVEFEYNLASPVIDYIKGNIEASDSDNSNDQSLSSRHSTSEVVSETKADQKKSEYLTHSEKEESSSS